MKILRRVVKLEHSGLLTVSPPVLERFTAALHESAHRLTGAGFKSIQLESAAWDQIMEDVMSRFCRRLSHADEGRSTLFPERIQTQITDIPSVRSRQIFWEANSPKNFGKQTYPASKCQNTELADL
jgi:hypothetical protein